VSQIEEIDMSELMDALRPYIGQRSGIEVACDSVETGAVRRYAQAIMDEDPIYGQACDHNARYGGPVAPPLLPTHLFRRPLGTEDPIQANAHNPDFDGFVAAPTSANGLPELMPLRGYALLNGGSDIEFFRYARHGETVTVQSSYADIQEKQTSKGPIVLVMIESEYRSGSGELLMKTTRTAIRRK
jgi:hypothetical protein